MGESDGKRVRFGGTVSSLLAWFAFIVALVGMTVRFAPVVNHRELLVAAFAPYLMLASLVACLLSWRDGRKGVAVLTLIPLAVGIGVRIPDYVADSPPDVPTIPIRVLTINLHDGTADPAAVAAAAREHADVLLVQELTPSQANSILGEPGLTADFPYRALDPRPWAAGVGIFSRYPIVQNAKITRYQLGAVTATLRPPGAASDVLVASIHLAGPWPQPIDGWLEEIDALPETLEQLALTVGRGTAIVGGDFNATKDFRPFRKLLEAGFADAVGQSGGGLGRTYPADTLLPPIVGIDHILSYHGWASESHTVRIAGTDHRGMAATIHVPA